MHTLETTIITPFLLFFLAAGIALCAYTVQLVCRQAEQYAAQYVQEESDRAFHNTDVLRVTEVIYETVTELVR